MKSTIILASNNEKSFSKEIVNKLIDILTQNKVQYEVIDLYKDNFNPVMTAKQEQLYSKGETDDELVKKYQKHLKESDEIILVFPLWFNNVPAILKGFFDKVFLKEFAFTEENNKPKGLLNNIKSGLVISTSESNSEYLIEGLNNPIETVVVKGTLGVCGIENVEYININVENEDKYDFIEKYFTTTASQSLRYFLRRTCGSTYKPKIRRKSVFKHIMYIRRYKIIFTAVVGTAQKYLSVLKHF